MLFNYLRIQLILYDDSCCSTNKLWWLISFMDLMRAESRHLLSTSVPIPIRQLPHYQYPYLRTPSCSSWRNNIKRYLCRTLRCVLPQSSCPVTFFSQWSRHRPLSQWPDNRHSIYMDCLAELHPVVDVVRPDCHTATGFSSCSPADTENNCGSISCHGDSLL